MSAPVMLSFGHGYSARALAARLPDWTVIGTTRSAAKAAALGTDEALIWPGGDIGPALARATQLLVSVPPGEGGDPVLAAFGDAIAARAGKIAWAGYLSTVGVYGDREGAWVDERSELRPATARGRARVEAEAAWTRLARQSGLPLHIFRLAGIYGPGRGPFAKLRAGTARRIVKPGQVFSRIHVDDIATVLAASIARPDPGAVYNVCDDEPAPPEDVIAHAARLLGLPVPPAVSLAQAEMSPMARSFYAESKRVSNRRIREDLGVDLAHPTYREGLVAVLAAERGAMDNRREEGWS